MDFFEVMEIIAKVFSVLGDVLNWLNDNIFTHIGTVVDVIKKVVDFISGLIGGDGLSGITDMIGGLFG